MFFFSDREIPALCFRKGRVNPNKILALILTKIQNFKTAVGLVLRFELTLHADETFAGCMDSKATEITADPFAAKLFCDSQGCAGTAEKIGDEITFVRRSFYDAFE